MPSEYEGVSAYLYSIGEGSQYIPNQPIAPDPDQGTTSPPNLSGGLFIVILVVLVAGIPFLSKFARKQKQDNVTPPVSTEPSPQSLAAPQFASSAQIAETKFCRYCGALNKADAVFCEKCGKSIR
jgi:ribosomal protein L40E